MCGIIGYKGKKRASEVLLKGLKNLEYRGYDSVGMVLLDDNGFSMKKDKGRVSDVHDSVNFLDMNGSLGMGHTRWSTHGKPSKDNSHPHFSNDGKIAVIHNGIIENYDKLREQLILEGYEFQSETDTEVIPNLIQKFMADDDFETSVFKAIQMLEGTFALVILNKESGKMIAAKRLSPLILGIGEGEFFLASDVNGFVEHTKDVVYLEDNEMVVIDENYSLLSLIDGSPVNRERKKIEWDVEDAQKDGFDHYMMKEIFEQPAVMRKMVNDRIKDSEVVFDDLTLDDDYLKGVKRIILLACGTAHYACITGKYMLESLGKVKCEVDYASEFRYRNPIVDEGDLVIAITQSGETADTLAAVKEAKEKGAKILTICNVEGSAIPRESDATIYTRAGPEIGVASTKAFLSQIGILYLFGIYLAKLRRSWSGDHLRERLDYFRRLPNQIESILQTKETIENISNLYYDKSNALYLGRGTNYPIAMEGAIKLKEVSYIHAEGYPAAEMKHGPIALIDENMPVFVIAVKDDSYVKIKSNIEEIRSRGGIVISLATEGDDEIIAISDRVIYVPKTSGLLYPFLTVVPFQLLAYYIANKRGCDVDKPRSLAKSVTVE